MTQRVVCPLRYRKNLAMSKQRIQTDRLRRGVLWAYNGERTAQTRLKKVFYRAAKWVLMLAYEGIKDNSKVRAESLAYLMIFSLIPLLAGAVFIFSFLTQFAFVQESVQGAIDTILSRFPVEHRNIILEYGIALKDRYLASISAGSAKFGIFALGVFLYVGVQTFNNIDRTINYIWGSDTDRPYMEKVRNFLVVALVAPVAISASLSVPLIIRSNWGRKIHALAVLTSLESVIGALVPLAISFATFLFIYKLVPVRKVRWSSALAGAVFGSVGLQVANSLVSLYVRFATQTTYGKAAVFLVLGFWIFVVWFIVIMGAQVSYLYNDNRYLLKGREAPPSMYEGYSLILILKKLLNVYRNGGNPISYQELFEFTQLGSWELRRVMAFLESQSWVARVAGGQSMYEGSFLLAKDLSQVLPSQILRDFMKSNVEVLPQNALNEPYQNSFEDWATAFDEAGFV